MRRYMELAIKKAMSGVRKRESPFGACIVRGKEVVAVAHNTVLSHKDSTNHAEMNAIRLACRKLGSHKLKGCTIYSTTEPCPMCFAAAHWAGVAKIVYGTNIGDVKGLGFSELTISNKEMKREGRADIKIEPDFMRAECMELLSSWKRKHGRTY